MKNYLTPIAILAGALILGHVLPIIFGYVYILVVSKYEDYKRNKNIKL